MNGVHLLHKIEIERLQQVHRQTRDANVRSRCEMILLSNRGLTPLQIAERVRFSRRTVTRVIQRYEAERLRGGSIDPNRVALAG